ncbi:MAG: hypothetical protein ACREOM_07430 [Candidatus Dormibacteraceae bacterium]
MGNLWRSIGGKRLLVTALCLVAWRALDAVQVFDVRADIFFVQPHTYSLVALGLQPYVYALIILTVARACSGRLRAISADMEGRWRVQRWTRILAAALAMGGAYGLTLLMEVDHIVPSLDWFARLVFMLQLTAGTMTLVLLGDILDEFGLGFGNGALFIFAFTSLAIQAQRLRDLVGVASQFGDLTPFRPIALWLVASLLIVTASVAFLRAYRRVPLVQGRRAIRSLPLAVPIVLSGVLRPPIFTTSVLFVPVIYSNYLTQSQPGFHQWIVENWTPYGTNPWFDAIYIAISTVLVIAFAFFVVAIDFDPRLLAARLKQGHQSIEGVAEGMEASTHLRAKLWRLTFAGGCFLALATVVLPDVVGLATRALGQGIPASGTDIVLVTAVVLVMVTGVEGYGAGDARSELSPVPSVI